mgnify:CR=1 FL=1
MNNEGQGGTMKRRLRAYKKTVSIVNENYTKDLELKRRDFFLKELTRKADSILLWELNRMR